MMNIDDFCDASECKALMLDGKDNYRLTRKEDLWYIVNNQGKIVSDGYHSITPIKDTHFIALLGQLGATGRLLKIPHNNDDFFIPSEARFHNIEYDSNIGYVTTTLGSLTYVLDLQTGEFATEGHHELFLKKGVLWGVSGTESERVKFKGENPVQEENIVQKVITYFRLTC